MGRDRQEVRTAHGEGAPRLVESETRLNDKLCLVCCGTSAIFKLFVDDADSAFQRAVDAGATPMFPPSDSFYGDRVGHFLDPSGHIWPVSSVKEVLTPEELYRRMLEHFAPQGV